MHRSPIKSLGKSLVGRIATRIGQHRRLLNNGTIVAFHRVTDQFPMNDLIISESLFRDYCQFFRRYFDVIGLSELVDDLSNGRSLSGKLAITFDDGYRDNFDSAAPILLDMGLPATFFIVSRFIGTDHLPWWDKKAGTPARWMTWEQIRSLVDRGFEIGSHTCSHVNLSECSAEQAEYEIRQSLHDICNNGIAVRHFSYPFGMASNFNEQCRQIVRDAGYASCSTLDHSQCRDPFDLGRVPISSFYRSPFHFLGDVIIQSGRN